MQALLDGARPAAVGGEQLKVPPPSYFLLTTTAYHHFLLTTHCSPLHHSLLKVADFLAKLPEPKRALVHARLLDYVQTNQNHLDMYLVPSSAIMKKMEDTQLM